jgi:putative transposase
MVFHVLNRGVGQMRLFEKDADYDAFEGVAQETLLAYPMRICAYCIMPTHWHFILWPEEDDQLAAFLQRLTITHARRWQEHRGRVGLGHVYQGRYKSFPVETDDYFYQVVRYVERNPLRAELVTHAEQWRWSSLRQRLSEVSSQPIPLSPWPLPIPTNWRTLVNQPQHETELKTIRHCLRRGQPFGNGAWTQQTAHRLGLESTLRAPHRPHKQPQ